MTSKREWFANLKPVKKSVSIGDGTVIDATGTGDIYIKAFDGTSWKQYVLKEVLYVPNLKLNLFSASSVADKGNYKIITDKNTC